MAFDRFELNKIIEERSKIVEETKNTCYLGLDGFQKQQKYKKIIPDTVEYDVDGAEAYVEIFKTVLEKGFEKINKNNTEDNTNDKDIFKGCTVEKVSNTYT